MEKWDEDIDLWSASVKLEVAAGLDLWEPTFSAVKHRIVFYE